MITMNENRMVRLIKDNLHNRVHSCCRDRNLLGSLHINHFVTDIIFLDETFELGSEVLLYKRSMKDQHLNIDHPSRSHLQNGLQAERLKILKVFDHRPTAAIDLTRDDDSIIE